MNEYSTSPIFFNSISGKKVQADFDGGEITSDAGVLLLKEAENHIGIIDSFARCIRDRRDQRYVKQEMKDILSQRIYQIAAGYEDANDANTLCSDPAFKMAVGRLPSTGKNLASQPTISRMENDARRSDLIRMAYALADQFISSYSSPPAIIVLDFDDTADKTHGMQQLSLFNTYYDSHCYLPLHIYEGISGRLIGTILRPGKRPTGKQIVSILKRLVKSIRLSWPKTIILFRGDSHFCAPEVLSYCDNNGLLYGIGLSGNQALLPRVESLAAKARAIYEQSGIKVKLYDELQYQAGSWDAPHRVITKVEYSSKGSNIRFVVTNLTEPDPMEIYKHIYCGRGQMENYIKDHKLHLKSDRTSCRSFTANQFRLFLHSAAYTLLHALRDNILKGTEFASAQFNTIQLKLLKIGARVREMKTRINLHFPSSFPCKSILYKAGAIFSFVRLV
jgi:hypothetical protein